MSKAVKGIKSYSMDYSGFMPMDIHTFVNLAGWSQIAVGILLFAGLLTRLNAAILTLMGLVTIIIPGLVVMQKEI